MAVVIARFRCWRRYRRHLNRLIDQRLDLGYNVSGKIEERFRAEARRVAGY